MAITLGEAKPFIEQAKFGQSQATGQLQTQIQQAAQSGGPAPKTEQIQKLAGEVATTQAQPVLQAQQAAAEQAAQSQKLQANQERLGKVRKIQETRQVLQEKGRENEQRLFNLSATLKAELYDNQMKFQKDELGRTLLNERQLADWAIMRAKNEEDLQKYEQITQQTLQKKEMLLNHAWKMLEQQLESQFARAEQEKDFEQKKMLYQMKKEFEEKKRRMLAEEAGKAALWKTGGAIVGGVIGAYFGGPAGAMAGASAGSAAGGMAYSKTK
jgi:hypothetical protein